MASTILLTTGVPGCGKSYVRAARFLVDDFLINSTGVHYSNFPLNVDLIANDVAARLSPSRFSLFSRLRRKVSADDIKKRLWIIPDDELKRWHNEESGPWEYFKHADLKYAHIAIDEIHNYVSPAKSAAYLQKWDEFLGEIRHRGCTFEGLTQDESQVHQILIGRASLRLELIPAEDTRDPFFKIPIGDWYELKASFSGSYHKTVFEFEKRKQGRGWKLNHVRRFLITPDYWKYYNSYNASIVDKIQGTSDSESSREILHEYQRRSRVSLFFWFLRRNFFTLSWRIAVIIFVVWLCFFGGLTYFITQWLLISGNISASNSRPVQNTSSVSTGSSASDPSVSPSSDLPQPLFSPADLFKPAMFYNNQCWLRNGIKIEVDYIFTEGVYNGKKVVSIDPGLRCYSLDDGTVVNMF